MFKELVRIYKSLYHLRTIHGEKAKSEVITGLEQDALKYEKELGLVS
jgi:hypothetical protein